MTDCKYISIEVGEGIGRITLDRPEVMNALNPEMMGEIAEAAERLGADPAVRVLVIDAVGKGFSAGGDKDFLEAVGNLRPFEIHDQVYAYFGAAVRAVKLCPKPTIAAVNGPAYGAGCELALACDFRLANEHAAFAENWIGLGLISPLGGMLLLPRIEIGRASCRERV